LGAPVRVALEILDVEQVAMADVLRRPLLDTRLGEVEPDDLQRHADLAGAPASQTSPIPPRPRRLTSLEAGTGSTPAAMRRGKAVRVTPRPCPGTLNDRGRGGPDEVHPHRRGSMGTFMKLVKKFSQSDLIDQYESSTSKTLPTPGICFRVTYKWAGCMLFGGEFKYDQLNVVKTADKHVAYRQKTLAYAGGNPDWNKDDVLKDYVALDACETLGFVNQWGVKLKDANSTVYNGLYVEDQSDEPIWDYLAKARDWRSETLIMTFYGRKNQSGTTKPAGHAVAFSGREPCFFDANDGVFAFNSTDPVQIGAEIKSHIDTNYTNFTHEYFNLLLLNTRTQSKAKAKKAKGCSCTLF
jgi:hypothetical protein